MKLILVLIMLYSLPSFANQSCGELFGAQNQVDVVIRELYGLKYSFLNEKDPGVRSILSVEFAKKEKEILSRISQAEYQQKMRALKSDSLPIKENKKDISKEDTNSEVNRYVDPPQIIQAIKLTKPEHTFLGVSNDLKYIAIQNIVFGVPLKAKMINPIKGFPFTTKPNLAPVASTVLYERTSQGTKEVLSIPLMGDVSFSSQSRYMFLHSNKGRFDVIDIGSKKPVKIPSINDETLVADFVISKDETQIATTMITGGSQSNVNRIQIYNLNTKSASTLKIKSALSKMVFIGNNLLVIYKNKNAELYDSNFKIISDTSAFKLKHRGAEIVDLKITKDDSVIHYIEKNSANVDKDAISILKSVRTSDWNVERTLEWSTERPFPFKEILPREHVSQDGQFLFIVNNEGLARGFEIRLLNQTEDSPLHFMDTKIRDYNITPDSRYIVTQRHGEADILIWEWK